MNEFQFRETASNAGELTCRCIALTIGVDDDDFTDGERELINEIVACLNQHFDFGDHGDD